MSRGGPCRNDLVLTSIQNSHRRQVRILLPLKGSSESQRRRNYTGDVLNFGLAKEQYAAEHGKKPNQVKFLVVGDDVAVGKTQGDIVGRR